MTALRRFSVREKRNPFTHPPVIFFLSPLSLAAQMPSEESGEFSNALLPFGALF